MLRFFEIQGPNCRETLHRPLPKATLVCKKKKPEREGTPAPEKPSLIHFHYGNTTELGAAGQFVTSLDSSGSVRPACFKPGLQIYTHLSHEHDNPHAHDNYNDHRIVRERGRQVIRTMWRVEQEHDIIGIFHYTRGWQQEGTAENTSGEPS